MIRSRILFVIAALLCSATVVGPALGQGSSTATGISRALNPAISLNTLLLGQVSRDDSSREANQIGLQEMEIQFSAVVDPFWTADLILAVHPEHADEDGHGGHFALEVEKAMVTYGNMPRGWSLRVGRDYLPFGKQIPLHTHQFAFVEAPVAVTAHVGDHGLLGTGAELAWNVPLPWWAELTLYGMGSDAEVFAAESRDLVYGGRLTNLWDLTETSTLELGGSTLTGPGAGHEGEPSLGHWRLHGADLTWKHVPGRDGLAVTLTNEVLWPDAAEQEGSPLGFYSHLQMRVKRNWWLGVGAGMARDADVHEEHGEHDEAGEEDEELQDLRQFKVNLTYVPSEFSSLRLGLHYDEDTAGDYRDLGAYLQLNFTIGSHPAHTY